MRGGDAVIRALEQEGILYITGFSGGGLAPLWQGLRAVSYTHLTLPTSDLV